MELKQCALLLKDQVQRKSSTLRNRLPLCPSILWIELTNKCNLHCSTCSRNTLGRPLVEMDWRLFKKIARQAAQYHIRRVKLNRFGEPLLHPEVHRMTGYVKSLGVPWVFFATNGTLLDAATQKAVLESGLDLLAVSIDGFTADTYERIRRGARLEEVRQNVEDLIHLRNNSRKKRPLVQVNAILTKENEHELPALVRYWNNRADFVNIMCYTGLSADEHPFLDNAQALQRARPCEFLTSSLLVLANGDVTVCCADYNGELSVGNVERENLGELWNGERYRRIRTLQHEGRFDELPRCGLCLFTQRSRRQALFRRNHQVYRIARKEAR